jgi:hypothetical protein
MYSVRISNQRKNKSRRWALNFFGKPLTPTPKRVFRSMQIRLAIPFALVGATPRVSDSQRSSLIDSGLRHQLGSKSPVRGSRTVASGHRITRNNTGII